MAPHFGFPVGEKLVTTGWTNLIDGLTISRYVYVKPLTTNRGDLFVKTRDVTSIGTGFRLEPTESPVLFDTREDLTMLQIKASSDGNTVGYMGTSKVAN